MHRGICWGFMWKAVGDPQRELLGIHKTSCWGWKMQVAVDPKGELPWIHKETCWRLCSGPPQRRAREYERRGGKSQTVPAYKQYVLLRYRDMV